MKDPFEHHGLKNLSASQINEYIASPAKWLLRVSGYRDNSGGPPMWRGRAVDQAISYGLENLSLSDEEIQDYAIKVYDDDHANGLKTAIFDDAKVQKEKDALSGFISVAMPHYRSLGPPIESQSKIVLEIEDVPVPIVGYIDLLYEGVVRDIKTVSRLPSRVPTYTCRQLAIYANATNSIPIVDYLHSTKTKQQLVVMPVPDHASHWKVVVKAAKNMTKLLSISSDIEEIAGLLMPDFDDWRWSTGEKNAARRLWRLNDE
jgi:hypothetical protein